ncbi:hypothetical protein SCHPADRAFT_901342 [Schizopora paradoxa]|uniref:Pali-domain-containing protein n=1 Tax=Schizopora paradoxa TaxID=27342 RepID=A0A0H2RY79_9AGAM|nr:hypothetical protein SCHPADRAFT_901342 [Schizopora paradoxa]
MSRLHWGVGIFFLVAAFVLLVIVSISLPTFSAVDIVRTHFATAPGSSSTSDTINQLRLGIWGYCVNLASDGTRDCVHAGHAYKAIFLSSTGTVKAVGSGSTRGLPAHVAAAIVTLFALLFAISNHLTLMLVSSLLCFIAAFITLIAFGIDIGLLVSVRNTMNDLSGHTVTAPGFWMTFASIILLLLAGMTVCFRRRRSSRYDGAASTSTKGGFWPFRRNRY